MSGDGQVCKTVHSFRPPSLPDLQFLLQPIEICNTSKILQSGSWPRIKAASALVVTAVNDSRPGGYAEIAVP